MKSLLFVVAALLMLLTGILQQQPAVATGPAAPPRPASKAPAGHRLIVVRKSTQAPTHPKTVRALPSPKPTPH